MKFLVIGLGSMGKRRVRNLQKIKVHTIWGFDLREDRCQDVEKKYGIEAFGDIKKIDLKKVDAIIISTPPDKHNQWIKFAIDNKKPVFVEASVVLKGLEELNSIAQKNKVLICPSCTLRFHPAIKTIKQLVKSNKYGKLTNFSYHMGQYLPDWHPWEKLNDCYTSKKITGGAREMVAFELTWLVDITNLPKRVTGFCGKTMDMGVDIDDTYLIALEFSKSYGNLTIDVTSRYAIRSLILNLEQAQIHWRWDENVVKLYDSKTEKWKNIKIKLGQADEGYNPNITEQMYIDEMRAFVAGILKKKDFPNTLDDDIKVLQILEKIENKKI